jgi:signal transduction histidine kinase
VNLVKNALEAGEATGGTPEITLSASAENHTAWITVTDNGPGLPPENLRRIFDDGYTTKGAGRGRGLAIVRESVHLQRGEIVAENLPTGGTRFRIGLELDPGAA